MRGRAAAGQESPATPARRRRDGGLTAKGLTTGDGQASGRGVLAPTCPVRPSPRSPTGVREEMAEWLARPLKQVYATGFIDAIVVKVTATVSPPSRPADTAIGVAADGTRDIRGIWIGQGVRAPSSGCRS